MRVSANVDGAQTRLRNSIAEQARDLIERNELGFVEAAAAIFGAAAILIGVLPVGPRKALLEEMIGAFEGMVDRRAKEIRSGEFDDAISRGRQ